VTAVVTWNIQNGRGCDGVVDLARIARVIKGMGEVDVVCLQEVARNDPEYESGADQVAKLAKIFAGYEGRFGAALNRAGNRQYGNLVLSRLPIVQSFNHLLPDPPAEKHMQRQATEVVVQTAAGPLRVMTAHLEFYAARNRAVQIARLRELQAEAEANQASPPKPDSSPYDAVPRPAPLVLCGDFNLLPDDSDYRALFVPPLTDAWRHARKGEPHPSTTGLHDRKQWPMGGHCRNYFAATADVAARIHSIEMDAATDASDHQPLRLVLR
jgi:endonuclease/exonuclease/phosphatase family metal-dependent hydrolase